MKKKKEKIMKVIKKIVIIILAILMVLFTIQLIDQAINGETYAKIDNYLEAIKKTNRTEDARICKEKSILILNGTLIAKIKDNQNLIKDTLKDKKSFDNTINACNSNINDLSKVQIPKLGNLKEKELIGYKQHLISSKMKMKDVLELLRTCDNSFNEVVNLKCNNLLEESMKEAVLAIEFHAKLKKRLTVKYVLTRPWGIFIERKMSELEKERQKYSNIKE
jgi:hypothetical protein